MSNFKKVEKFMKTFGQEVKHKPGFPSEKITKLRYDLILEEFVKVIEHILDVDSLLSVARNI